jgi:Zn-finger nucleic acid-binding protein
VCAIALTRETVDGIDIDRCAQCRGVWLDPGEYEVARQRLRKSVASPPSRHRTGAVDTAGSLAVEGLTEVLLWLGRTLS